MPLSFTTIGSGTDWAGSAWTVGDEEKLATLIARVALGQSRQVERILTGTGFKNASPSPTAAEGAKHLLSIPPGQESHQRDGWLFQTIAWIAAHKQNSGALIRAPQMRHADKGFDGLHVLLDAKSGNVLRVTICEEKATDNARQLIKTRVWQEFKELETGKRDNELVAEVSALLAANPSLNADDAIETILWKEARAYRVAITVGDTHATTKGQKRLFKGYKDIVLSDVARRRAEILHIADLRSWMNAMADKAIAAVDKLVNIHV